MRKMPQHFNQKVNEKHWFAVYTYFRREKSAVSALQKNNIQCFIPLLQRTKRYERKIKHYQVPLINQYIFVYIKQDEINKVLECRDVIRFIRFGKKPSPIPAEEISILKRISGEKSLKDILALRPSKPGEVVEIIRGNLAGLRGRLVQLRNKDQVLIDLHHMAYSIKLEIKISDLSLIQKPALSS